MFSNLRVGAYVDGMNLYHGGMHLCGRGTPGWRWLDLAALVERLISRNGAWEARGARLHRLVYCTALIRRETSSEAAQSQQAYLAALDADDRIEIEYGRFQNRRVRGDSEEHGVAVTVVVPEEKGSDVNLASHLLIDIYTSRVDAAVLISNDSDFRFPAQHARNCVQLGTVNPRGSRTATDLGGTSDDGVGGHWWYRLKPSDLYGCQLPGTVGGRAQAGGLVDSCHTIRPRGVA